MAPGGLLPRSSGRRLSRWTSVCPEAAAAAQGVENALLPALVDS